MKQYLELLEHVYFKGIKKEDRTGTGTRSVFGYQMRFDLSQGFPLLTTKALHLPSIVYELLWFISGDTNVRYLQEHGVRIWNEWASPEGDLGPVYGKQWRDWDGIDQLSQLIQQIKINPDSRRLVLSAWNVSDLPKMALAPCHCLFQFYVNEGKLSCQLYQRSADVFLGVPFNIASYSLLTHMVAQVCDLEVGDFVHSFGDVHLYNNHVDQAQMQLNRIPKRLPTLEIDPDIKHIEDFVFESFKFKDYNPLPNIKAPVAV